MVVCGMLLPLCAGEQVLQSKHSRRMMRTLRYSQMQQPLLKQPHSTSSTGIKVQHAVVPRTPLHSGTTGQTSQQRQLLSKAAVASSFSNSRVTGSRGAYSCPSHVSTHTVVGQGAGQTKHSTFQNALRLCPEP